MVEVRVNVPLSRETEFYRWFADWRDGKLTEAHLPQAEPGTDTAALVDDVSAAEAWWKLLRRREREIWSLWIDAAPRLLKAEEIVESLGLSGPREIPGILSWVGRKGKKVGFNVKWRFTSDPIDGAPSYGIDDAGYAELLRNARQVVEEDA